MPIQTKNKMHILLIVYLLITLVASMCVLKNNIKDVLNETNSKNITLLIVSLLDIFFTIMLFKWKKWALYGLGMTTFVIFIYNLTEGFGFLVSLLGLFGFVIICALLLLKKEGNNGYHNLE